MPGEPEPYKFPFMLLEAKGEQAVLYQRVYKAMRDIHHDQSDKTARRLRNIAEEWYVVDC